MFLKPWVPWPWPSVVTNRLGVWQEHGSPNLMVFSPWWEQVGQPGARAALYLIHVLDLLPPCWPPVQTWPRSRRGSSWALVLRSHRLLRPSRISPGPPIGAWRPKGLPGTASEAAHGPVSPCLQGRVLPVKGWLWVTRAAGHLCST